MGILLEKVAVVTGAGSGLGRVTALRFAEEGATVILCGRRLGKLEETARLIGAAGGRAQVLRLDISSERDGLRMAEFVRTAYGRIDLLINNASVVELGSVADTSLDSWNYQISVNLTGTFLMTKACLPHMRERRYGRIVNITSSLADNGAGGYAAYGVSKAGLETLTRTVAEEESNFGILTNMYNPGALRTEMHATGQDPATAVPDILALASLPKHGPNGKLFEVGGLPLGWRLKPASLERMPAKFK